MSHSTTARHTALPYVTRHYCISHNNIAFHAALSHFTQHYRISHGTTAFLMVHPHLHGTTVFTRRYRISRRTAQSISKFNANHKIQGGYQNSAPYCHNKRHSDSHSFTFAGTVPTKDSAVYGHFCGHLRGLSPQNGLWVYDVCGYVCGDCPHGGTQGFLRGFGVMPL